jgi:hypothetical protein
MMKMTAVILSCSLLTTLGVVDAKDTKDSEDHQAKTQGDIMRERAKACEGLHEQALRTCLDNYVGPSRDLNTSDTEAGGNQGKSEDNKKSEDAAQGGEHDGSSQVDMTKAKKRGPVGPMRSGPEDKQHKD